MCYWLTNFRTLPQEDKFNFTSFLLSLLNLLPARGSASNRKAALTVRRTNTADQKSILNREIWQNPASGQVTKIAQGAIFYGRKTHMLFRFSGFFVQRWCKRWHQLSHIIHHPYIFKGGYQRIISGCFSTILPSYCRRVQRPSAAGSTMIWKHPTGGIIPARY